MRSEPTELKPSLFISNIHETATAIANTPHDRKLCNTMTSMLPEHCLGSNLGGRSLSWQQKEEAVEGFQHAVSSTAAVNSWRRGSTHQTLRVSLSCVHMCMCACMWLLTCLKQRTTSGVDPKALDFFFWWGGVFFFSLILCLSGDSGRPVNLNSQLFCCEIKRQCVDHAKWKEPFWLRLTVPASRFHNQFCSRMKILKKLSCRQLNHFPHTVLWLLLIQGLLLARGSVYLITKCPGAKILMGRRARDSRFKHWGFVGDFQKLVHSSG